MKIQTTTHQRECIEILTDLEILGELIPAPPRDTCDGMTQVGPSTWIIATNSRGRYTVHLLEDATPDEAMRELERIHGTQKLGNVRIAITGGTAPANN